MSNRTVKVNELNEGDIFFVTGLVDFSKITSQIAGEDLKKDNARRKERGASPVDRPYTRLSLTNARGLQATAAGNTPLDIFAKESPFDRKNRDASEAPFYEAMNKGVYLPTVYQREKDNSLTTLKPEGELAQGLHVTCMMRIYGSKNFANKGISLDAVICEAPISYYQPNSTASTLAAMGMKVNNPEAPRRAETTEEPAAQTGGQTQPAYNTASAPQMPYASTPMTPPQGNPYAAKQEPQGFVPANPSLATPTPAAPAAAQAAPVPAGMPMQPNNEQPFPAKPGIVYTPENDPNRGY